MVYVLGLIGTYIFLTQESRESLQTRKELILALCASLVWPLLVICFVFYYLEEISFSITQLMGLTFEEGDQDWPIAEPTLYDFSEDGEFPER